jgi:hypothetical protein
MPRCLGLKQEMVPSACTRFLGFEAKVTEALIDARVMEAA